MNNNRTRVLAILMLLVMALSAFALEVSAETPTMTIASAPGSGFCVESTSPAADKTNVSLQNVAIKLIFDRPVTADATVAANTGIFTVVAEDGTVITYQELTSAKNYPNEVWLQLDSDLANYTVYTVTVPAATVADDGSVLGTDYVFSFTTRNAKKDNSIYMVLMLVMFGGMFAFTAMDAKKKQDENQKSNKEKAASKVNPYKESKRTGKSVAEVNSANDARKAKQAAKAAKLEAEKDAIRKEIIAEREAARKAAMKHCKAKKSGKYSYVSTGRAFPKAYIQSIDNSNQQQQRKNK